MPKNNRFWEIDSLRGIAIIMMIVFHFLFDLNFFNIFRIETFEGFWGIFGKITFTIFLLLAGIPLTLSSSSPIKRGLKIFFWGMIITLITYLVIPHAYVRFGILHLIGISIIISYPFLRFKYANLAVGIAVIIVGLYIQTITFDFSFLIWLGFKPNGYFAVDHFPIMPYWGIVLIGLFLGKILYSNHERNFKIPNISIPFLEFLGRHSLVIYLVHQPLLIILLYGWSKYF